MEVKRKALGMSLLCHGIFAGTFWLYGLPWWYALIPGAALLALGLLSLVVFAVITE